MKIGIIGAGNIGTTLARKLAASGHDVKLANSKGPDTIRDLAREIRASAVSKEEAVQDVAVIVLSIPFARYPDLAKRVLDIGARTILVPFVQNVDEARAAVQAARYPPAGTRGVTGTSHASRYGRAKNYFSVAK